MANEKCPASVLALTVLDTELVKEKTNILLCIRRPECNVVHPDVASVPTERVPRAVLETLMFEKRLNSDTAAYAIQSVLCHKLGLADAIEYGNVHFTAIARTVCIGAAPSPEDCDRPERLRMLNIAIHLSSGQASIPPSTASYSHLLWYPVSEFLRRATARESFAFAGNSAGTTIIRAICGGLCIRSAVDLLEKENDDA